MPARIPVPRQNPGRRSRLQASVKACYSTWGQGAELGHRSICDSLVIVGVFSFAIISTAERFVNPGKTS